MTVDVLIIVSIAAITIAIAIIVVIFKGVRLSLKHKNSELSISKDKYSEKVVKLDENYYCISQSKLESIIEEETKIIQNITDLRNAVLKKQMILAGRHRDILLFKVMFLVKQAFNMDENSESYRILKLMVLIGMDEFMDKIKTIFIENHLDKFKTDQDWIRYKEFISDYIFGAIQSKINEIAFSVGAITRKEFLEKCGGDISKINSYHVNLLMDEARSEILNIKNDIELLKKRQDQVKKLQEDK